MKNKKIIGSLVVVITILICFSQMFNSIEINTNLDGAITTSQEEIRYTEIFENIYIDGNFSDVVESYKWASGRGDIFDPYVIEAVSMINSMIRITNVDYFEVRDSSFFNYSHPYRSDEFAGLVVGNSRFGTIKNNIFTNCSTGVSLYDDAEDIQILNNQFFGSHNDTKTGGKAILIINVVSVIIEENYIYGYYDGIGVWYAGKIHVMNNRIETLFGYISTTGLTFVSVNDSSVISNDFYGCTISEQDSDIINTSEFDGLQTSSSSFIDCYNLTVSGNRFYDLDGNLIASVQDLDVLLLIIIFMSFIAFFVVANVVYVVRKKFKN